MKSPLSEALNPERVAHVRHNTRLLFDFRAAMAVPAEYGPRCLQLRDFLADRGSWKLAEPEYIIGCLQAARALGVRRGYSAQAGAALFDAVVKVLQQGIDADALDDETKARIFVWAREMHGIVSSEGIVGSHQESQGGFRTVSPMAASTVPVATVGLPNSPRATFSSVLPSRYNAFGQQIAQGAPRLVGSPQTQILPVTHAPTATTGLPTPRNAPARECSPRGARHDVTSSSSTSRAPENSNEPPPTGSMDSSTVAEIRNKVLGRVISEVRSKCLVEEILCTKGDGDVMCLTDSCTLSLRCPISLSRIDIPVRGLYCRHLDCFDLDTYICLNSRGGAKWRCPHCDQTVDHGVLAVDDLFRRILAEGGPADRVVVRRDGSWEVEAPRSMSADKRGRISADSGAKPGTTPPAGCVIVID